MIDGVWEYMVRAKCDNQYLSYILEDNTKFYSTGYRVLKKQKDKGFIPCSKINYNGHIKLLYSIEEYDPVSVAVEKWDKQEVFEWMLRILEVLVEVRDSGFLRIEDVDLDLSHIFVAEDAKSVYLIILPLSVDTAINVHWEDALCNTLISLVEISRIRNFENIYELKRAIRMNCDSIDDLYDKIKEISKGLKISLSAGRLSSGGHTTKDEIPKGELHLVLKNADTAVDIAVVKDSFIIGKNPKLSDGVLSISPTISRQHCKITREAGKYYIEDLDSLNHTFVNGNILQKGQKVWIQKGTQIHLANFEFSVEFRR